MLNRTHSQIHTQANEFAKTINLLLGVPINSLNHVATGPGCNWNDLERCWILRLSETDEHFLPVVIDLFEKVGATIERTTLSDVSTQVDRLLCLTARVESNNFS
ncbi:hypothetical protein GCM10009425_41140 [Pseudomonas asuensis]|uniref:Uncharacterized protein n=1 Tax=Pseudomonas asuensis TaxID=1825787 RepID=A0ABQ2H2N1_9PSED|nr:hypothetical protein GCM10009425_41140 [Pseudomonas asuensis]